MPSSSPPSTPSPPSRSSHSSPKSPHRHPRPSSKNFHHYLWFWGGQLVSLLGSSIVQFSAYWWLNEQRHNPVFLSTAIVLIQLPMLVISLFSGAIADKFSRKRIIILADLCQAIFTFLLILFFLFFDVPMWWVILLFVCRSICQSFHQPASNAIIPLMVPQETLSRMNGVNFLTTTAIQIVGPIISGFLLGIWDFYQILWIDLITFFIALIPALLIKIPNISPSSADPFPLEEPFSSVKRFPSEDPFPLTESFPSIDSDPRTSALDPLEIPTSLQNSAKHTLRQDIKEGFITLFEIKGMIPFFLMSVLSNFFFTPFNTMRPYFVSDYHHGFALEYALLATISQIGMLFGSLIMVLKKKWHHKTRTMMIGMIFISVMYLLTGIVPPGNFLLLYICGFFLMVDFPIINGLYMTILQIKIPLDKQGRVNAIDTTVSQSISPIMTFLSGPLTLLLGVQYVFIICAALNIIQVGLFWTLSKILELEQSHGS